MLTKSAQDKEKQPTISNAREIHDCEVCGAATLTPVLDLGLHPLCDDLVPVGDARICREYPIVIGFCEVCRTAHQQFQVPKHELFPASYHYRGRFTKDVLDGMQNLVDAIEKRFGPVAGKRVLDVGCNDGSLLGFLRARGATTFGIEPTKAALDACAQGHTIVNDYFGPAVAESFVASHGYPDVITFTNVFAHIERLSEVIQAVRTLIGPRTAIVIENHYLGSVLEGNQFDTFYQEHPRSYSYTSFVHIARQLDVSICDVGFPSRYGGNIRVLLQRGGPAGEAFAPIESHEVDFSARFEVMRDNVGRWRQRRGTILRELVKQHGSLRAKAFPGRAAILVKLLGLDERSIEVVHEKPGSMKIGHYLPGTRIPVVSDEELFHSADRARPIVNFAWHIPAEIRSYLARNGVTNEVVDIVTQQDFAAAN